MGDSTIESVGIATQDLVEPSSRLGWVEKHAELITKLEAEYQRPHDVKDELSDLRYYSYSSAGLSLLIPNDITSEVLEESNVHSIPLAPKWLMGACNVRGDIVPIIDINQILKNEKTQLNTRQNITLILGSVEKAIGLTLDQLPKAIQFKKEEQTTNYKKIPELMKPFITMAYIKNQKLWLCIDFPSLITSFTNK